MIPVKTLLRRNTRNLLVGTAITLAAPAFANAQEIPADGDEQIRSSRDIVVIGGIGFRNRSEETEQTLVYGDDYFQRFEPLTAGDALKRVPSVTFLSDVIESDGARLRGLDPGYTQILINGEKCLARMPTVRSFLIAFRQNWSSKWKSCGRRLPAAPVTRSPAR